MNAHELARQLLAGPDLEVVLAADSEGNSFHALEEVAQAMYWDDERQAYPTPEVIANPDSGYDEDDEAPEGAGRIVVLWP